MMENQTLLSVNGKIQIKCSQSTIENSMLIKELLEFSTMSQCGIWKTMFSWHCEGSRLLSHGYNIQFSSSYHKEQDFSSKLFRNI